MPTFTVSTDARLTTVDITDRVRDCLSAGDGEQVCTVFVEHTTAGITVNEAEPRLLSDIESFLDGVVDDDGWQHDTLDGNADSHLRALLVGSDVSLPVVDGEIALGRWQSVLLVECDGPRDRQVRVVGS